MKAERLASYGRIWRYMVAGSPANIRPLAIACSTVMPLRPAAGRAAQCEGQFGAI
jgi:hypothetical protein